MFLKILDRSSLVLLYNNKETIKRLVSEWGGTLFVTFHFPPSLS